jgi:hypothetical protein
VRAGGGGGRGVVGGAQHWGSLLCCYLLAERAGWVSVPLGFDRVIMCVRSDEVAGGAGGVDATASESGRREDPVGRRRRMRRVGGAGFEFWPMRNSEEDGRGRWGASWSLSRLNEIRMDIKFESPCKATVA